MNNFVIFCNTWDLKIVMESLLWEVFEYLKIRDKNWIKTAIICSSVRILFSKFFYLLQFPEPRCLHSFGIFLACQEPRPISTDIYFLGNSWKVCLWFKTLKSTAVKENCVQGVLPDKLWSKHGEKLQKKSHLMLDEWGGPLRTPSQIIVWFFCKQNLP